MIDDSEENEIMDPVREEERDIGRNEGEPEKEKW